MILRKTRNPSLKNLFSSESSWLHKHSHGISGSPHKIKQMYYFKFLVEQLHVPTFVFMQWFPSFFSLLRYKNLEYTTSSWLLQNISCNNLLKKKSGRFIFQKLFNFNWINAPSPTQKASIDDINQYRQGSDLF